MNFKNWLEMASFSLGQGQFTMPCNKIPLNIKLPCLEKQVGAIDMRFEDPGAYPPPYNKLNNGSQFAAKIPNSDEYLIYHGGTKPADVLLDSSAIRMGYLPIQGNTINYSPGAKSPNGYLLIPQNWFIQAQIFDTNYEIIKPALGDINGKRGLN